MLDTLIAESARVLCADDYTDAEIEAALGTAWALPRELIVHGTYFVAEVDGNAIACGGWSGAESQPGRQTYGTDSGRVARIRPSLSVRVGREGASVGPSLSAPKRKLGHAGSRRRI